MYLGCMSLVRRKRKWFKNTLTLPLSSINTRKYIIKTPVEVVGSQTCSYTTDSMKVAIRNCETVNSKGASDVGYLCLIIYSRL